uniref:Uncharacterized protein n=1 Tax=Parascaris equorum TaxID=6256 RepID=A0A914RJQ7_PAREQ
MGNFVLNESSGSGEEETEEGEANEGGKRMKGKYDERIEQLEKNIELKRNELLREKGMAEEERQALATELRAKEAELSRAKAEHDELMGKLRQIEKKLIVGGENMLEKAERQAKLLAESNAELERA